MAEQPLVGVVMGSDSDWRVMSAASDALAEFAVPHEVDVVSAHRMPRAMIEYGTQAESRGLRVVIAGAGGAAHLPGMLAAVTVLPVIGCRWRWPRWTDSIPCSRSCRCRRGAGGHGGGGQRAQRRVAGGADAGSGRPLLRERMAAFQTDLEASAGRRAMRCRNAGSKTRCRIDVIVAPV